jgi:hypothetical protein
MRKTFNVTEKDYDILPHLEKQVNMSQYLVSLVKQDMGKKKIFTEEQVIFLIKKYVVTDKQQPQPQNNDFPMESVMSILL